MGHLRTLKNTLYISAFIMTCGVAFAASAKDWEKLPDGRVVIEIDGWKLGLDPKAYTEPYFYFSETEVPGSDWKHDLKLSQAIADPDRARAYFKKELAAGGMIRVFVGGFSRTSDDIFYGKFNSSKMANGNGPTSYTIRIRNHKAPFNETKNCMPASENIQEFESRTDRYGFILVATEGSPKNEHYCLAAKKRLFSTPNDLDVNCNYLPPNFPACSFSYYEKERVLSVGIYFYPFPKLGAANAKYDSHGFSKDKWIALDKQMHDFYSYILLNGEWQ